MKILFVVTSDMTVATFLAPQVQLLQARGHEIRVLSGRDSHRADKISERWHAYISCDRSIASPGDVRAVGQIAWHLSSFSPDLIVAATPKASLLAAVSARFRRPSLPVVHLLWGLRSQTMSGLKGALVRRMERLTFALSSAVVANSGSLAAEVTRQGYAPAEKVHVLANGSSHGVNVERFRPREVRRTKGMPFTVGFVGRVSTDKGVPELLKAMEILSGRIEDIRLRIVGPVEEPASLVGADQLGSVTVEGPTDVGASTYWDLDVVCLPSYREGFPNVCLEAASCALPVVVSDATGCRDAVLDGVTGLRVPVGDPAALAAAFLDLAHDRARGERMGAAGRQWVLDFFEEGDVLDHYADFYEESIRSFHMRPATL